MKTITKKWLYFLSIILFSSVLLFGTGIKVSASEEKKVNSEVGISFDNNFTPQNKNIQGDGGLPKTGRKIPQLGSTSQMTYITLGFFIILGSLYIVVKKVTIKSSSNKSSSK